MSLLCGPCRGYITRSSCDYERVLGVNEKSRRLVSDGIQPGSELWDTRRPVRTWARKLRKLQRWKSLPGDNRWRYSRLGRLSTCYSELQSLWISDNVHLLQPPAHDGSSLADFSTLKMEAIYSSETSVHTRSTRRHIPEDGILQDWNSLEYLSIERLGGRYDL
jgi:hypothetical protein